MASRSSRTRLSEAERAERRQRDRERLKQAAEQLLTSEGWQRWVRVRAQAGRRRLSLLNREHDLADEISGRSVGEKVVLTVLRSGERSSIDVELGRRPAGSGP